MLNNLIKNNSMIHANDLMIGDWVEETNSGVGIVWAISFDDEHVVTLISNDITQPFIHVSMKDINPIPLTPEILVKNGFSTNGLDVSLFDRQGGDDFVGAANIQYVHELQHVLRLCGIDKKIVLY